MCLGIQVNKNKIGNLIALLASRLKPLYHTKLIKLLYLIDEEAVKDDGIPITWLDYQAWQYGPVAPETFFIQNETHLFDNYIEKIVNSKSTILKSKVEFDDSDFSDYDLEIIERVINKYGHLTAQELVELTHKKGSLWSMTTKENKIDFTTSHTSDYTLDFTQLIAHDEIKLSNYEEAKETMMFKEQIEKC